MKTIRFSPAKLDRYADDFFSSVDFHKKNSLSVTSEWLESHELAGLALRMWAVRMRGANKRAKAKRDSTK